MRCGFKLRGRHCSWLLILEVAKWIIDDCFTDRVLGYAVHSQSNLPIWNVALLNYSKNRHSNLFEELSFVGIALSSTNFHCGPSMDSSCSLLRGRLHTLQYCTVYGMQIAVNKTNRQHQISIWKQILVKNICDTQELLSNKMNSHMTLKRDLAKIIILFNKMTIFARLNLFTRFTYGCSEN